MISREELNEKLERIANLVASNREKDAAIDALVGFIDGVLEHLHDTQLLCEQHGYSLSAEEGREQIRTAQNLLAQVRESIG